MKEVSKICPGNEFYLCGYSFGACIAIEMALLLEKGGIKPKKLILLDGSHNFVASFMTHHKQRMVCEVGPKLETESLCAFVSQFVQRLQKQVSVEWFMHCNVAFLFLLLISI